MLTGETLLMPSHDADARPLARLWAILFMRSGNRRCASAADSAQPPPTAVLVASPDMTCSEHVHDLFDRCRRMLNQGGGHVLIDLRRVEAADTKLVACLVVLYRIARTTPARLELSVSGAVLDVARICRLEPLIGRMARRDEPPIAA